jgi:ABC-type uncharacterized transport system ATPase subunit
MEREPETLSELHNEILAQLKVGEVVTITLTEGDGTHELLESITSNMEATRCLNDIYHNLVRFVTYNQ